MPSVTDLKREKFLIAFLICVVIINLFFTIKDRCLDYERYTLYWIFNGAAIWCFLELADKDFLKKLNGVCKINILTQAVIGCLLWKSIYRIWGPTRYRVPLMILTVCILSVLYDFINQLVCMQLWGPYGPHLLLSGCVFYEYIQIHGHFFRFVLYTVGMAVWILCKI